MKGIVYHAADRKQLARMPRNSALGIREKILACSTSPASQASNIKTMSDGVRIRLRVGDWRVIMHDDTVLDVLVLGWRGSIYD